MLVFPTVLDLVSYLLEQVRQNGNLPLYIFHEVLTQTEDRSDWENPTSEDIKVWPSRCAPKKDQPFIGIM